VTGLSRSSTSMDEDDGARVPVLAPGEPVAPGYDVVEHLRRGQALDVYAVWSHERCCLCVAKAVRPDHRHVPRVRRRLVLEGRLLKTLGHPHLVRAYETVTSPDPVVILESLPGMTLEYLIESRSRRLPLGDLANLGLHLCSATRYLHGKGYLHLDLKPSNVIENGGLAKIIDLSVARPPGAAPHRLGTRFYSAPEQTGGGQVTWATDVWGIGTVLYEAATGWAAFEPYDDAEHELLEHGGFLQLHRRALPVRRRRRSLPVEFCAAVEQCLHPDPQERPLLADLMARLQDFMEWPATAPGQPLAAVPPIAGEDAG
jgi:serine/threonine protein kinase